METCSYIFFDWTYESGEKKFRSFTKLHFICHKEVFETELIFVGILHVFLQVGWSFVVVVAELTGEITFVKPFNVAVEVVGGFVVIVAELT